VSSIETLDDGGGWGANQGARTLLVSIHSHYAELILDGTKTVELRRRFDPATVGSRMLIYATLPTAAVIGHTLIDNVECLFVEDIWEQHSSRVSVSANAFSRYFTGIDKGFAIHIADPKRYSTPIPLRDMQGKHGLRAPQSYIFLRDIHRELIEHEQD
jgi:predicted transcriptional regulator